MPRDLMPYLPYLLFLAASFLVGWIAFRAWRLWRPRAKKCLSCGAINDDGARRCKDCSVGFGRAPRRSNAPVLLFAVGLASCATRTPDQSRALTASLAEVVQAKRAFRVWSDDHERKITAGLDSTAARARTDLTRPVTDKALDLLDKITDTLELALRSAR